MLILAIGGVLVGFVFLVVSLVTENSTWAWGCIVACVAAGVVLLVEARGRRSGRRTASSADGAQPVLVPGAASASPAQVPVETAPAVDMATQVLPTSDVRADEPTTVLTKAPPAVEAVEPEPVVEPETVAAPEPVAAAEPVAVPEPAAEPEPAVATATESGAEPDEEDADAADALVVAGLEHDVLVVDEHPRFHVAACTWLVGRATMSLPAREAVELGFSPCSRCAPSRTLAALTRA